MEIERKETPAWIKDVLEFGHNTGLAFALAGFGAAAYHAEAVRGPTDWNQYLGVLCIIVALVWGALAGSHLANQLLIHTRLTSRTCANVLIGGFCIGIGGSVVLMAPLIPDNNHIVGLCEKFEHDSTDKIHHSTECQRLYDRREAYEARLRGE